MITRKMIENGFRTGRISIVENYNGCDGIYCKIADNAFYFIGLEDNYLTLDEYWKAYTLEMTINMIFDILKDEKSSEENGLDDLEWGYYKSVLEDE